MREAQKHLLFVSHVTEDRVAAMEIVDALERRGVKCWITPRDVRPGRFDDQISDAIDHCSALLLIFSDRCNESDYIYREVTVAGEARKPILPLRIEDCIPRRGLRLRLMDIHWIDAFAARQEAIETIIRTVGTAEEVRAESLAGPVPPAADLTRDEAPARPADASPGATIVDVAAVDPAGADREVPAATSGPRPAGNEVRDGLVEEGRSPHARPKPVHSQGPQFDLGFILAATDGRSTRSQWWIGLAVLTAMAAILSVIIALTYGPTQTALILALGLQLFLIFPSYALSAKRFRDRGRPGVLALVGIALGILITLARMAGLVNPVPDTALDWTLAAVVVIVGIWYLVELGCLRGTIGTNDYGPDPLGGRPRAG